MFFFTLTIVTLAVMLATAIYFDKNHELRLGRGIVIVVVSMIPPINVIASIVCLIRLVIEVMSENKGCVIYRWKR